MVQLPRNENECGEDASTALWMSGVEGFTKFEKRVSVVIPISFVIFFRNLGNINRNKRKPPGN